MPSTVEKVPERLPASRIRTDVPTGGLNAGAVPMLNRPASVAAPEVTSLEKSVPGVAVPLIVAPNTPPEAWV